MNKSMNAPESFCVGFVLFGYVWDFFSDAKAISLGFVLNNILLDS